ncbi:MAG: IS21 family transposase, partial [Pseudomonadota bacterium]
MDIRVLWRQGLSIHEIVRRTGKSRNTVRRYIRSVTAEPVYGPRPQTPSLLDPFKPYLTERVNAAHPVRLPATVLMREIQERGYHGQLTILRDYLRTLQPEPAHDPVVRFETKPGEQMQVDWCQVRRGKNRLTAFVATMGHCRASYVQFATNEELDTLLTCLEDAFTFFGG